jgi:hypothetical protein
LPFFVLSVAVAARHVCSTQTLSSQSVTPSHAAPGLPGSIGEPDDEDVLPLDEALLDAVPDELALPLLPEAVPDEDETSPVPLLPPEHATAAAAIERPRMVRER